MARHYDITDWVDFVRSVADGDHHAAMQLHLDDGCESCATIVAALHRVAATTAADLAQEPAASALRSVKAFFATQHPEADSAWEPITLRRVFDSTVNPPVASRLSDAQVKQLLFESDDYTLELSVDAAPGAVDAVLRGQILEAHSGPRSHAPVFLVGHGEVLGRTISQEHGTFELSGRLEPPCELWVFPDDRHRIRVSLDPDE